MSQKRIIHYYGMSAKRYGLSDEEFADYNSMPTHGWNECLRRLQKEHQIDCQIHLFTDDKEHKIIRTHGLEFIFHPAFFRFLPSVSIGKYRLQTITDISFYFFKRLKQNPPDLFIFYGINSLFSFFVARWLKRNKVSFILLIHGIRPPKNFLIRYLLQNSLAIVVPTETTKRYIEDKFKIEKQNLFVIPSGINPEYFYPKKDVSDLNPPVLCFAGRLEENKGFLEALDCLKKVKNYFPKVKLKVAGKFISKDYKRLALGFIDRNKLSGNIVFYGYLPPSEMGGLYRSSDLLLFPSKKEAFGRAVVEAMMCGTAAVALEDSGGPETIIENGIDGVLSGQEGFAGNVIELLKNQDRLRQMSYQAIMNAKRKYSIDKIYLKVENLYLSFLKGGN